MSVSRRSFIGHALATVAAPMLSLDLKGRIALPRAPKKTEAHVDADEFWSNVEYGSCGICRRRVCLPNCIGT